MKDSSTKGIKKSSPTKDSQPLQTTLSLLAWDFNEQPIYGVPNNVSLPSRFQEKKGHRFGRWTLLTDKVFRNPAGYRNMKVICDCGIVSFRDSRTLQKGVSLGCDPCSRADKKLLRAPRWLLNRMAAAKDRCINPRCKAYPWYGGRGVEFRFKSSIQAANWIMDNLGLKRHLTLDRRNNEGHYEPGNMRYATQRQQVLNTRIPKMDFVYIPEEWPYSEQVVWKYLRRGFTREQVLNQAWNAVFEKRKRWRIIQEKLLQLTTS